MLLDDPILIDLKKNDLTGDDSQLNLKTNASHVELEKIEPEPRFMVLEVIDDLHGKILNSKDNVTPIEEQHGPSISVGASINQAEMNEAASPVPQTNDGSSLIYPKRSLVANNAAINKSQTHK